MVTFGRGLSGDGGLFSQHSCSWKGRCDQALRLVKEKKKSGIARYSSFLSHSAQVTKPNSFIQCLLIYLSILEQQWVRLMSPSAFKECVWQGSSLLVSQLSNGLMRERPWNRRVLFFLPCILPFMKVGLQIGQKQSQQVIMGPFKFLS